MQAGCIMCLSHFTSALALANGLNPEDTSPIPGVDLSELSEHPNWKMHEHPTKHLQHKYKSSPHSDNG